MPPAFPSAEFRGFGQAASNFFPALLSDEALFDPQEKRRNFDWSWQAVRYRYRSCAECQDEFRALLTNASEEWRAGLLDEELTHKLERCIYLFFMSAQSVFDSFAYCLYFLGHAIQPGAFPAVANPRHQLGGHRKSLRRRVPPSENHRTSDRTGGRYGVPHHRIGEKHRRPPDLRQTEHRGIEFDARGRHTHRIARGHMGASRRCRKAVLRRRFASAPFGRDHPPAHAARFGCARFHPKPTQSTP